METRLRIGEDTVLVSKFGLGSEAHVDPVRSRGGLTHWRVLPYVQVAFMVNSETKRPVRKPAVGRAILTDIQFWIPLVVLVLGLLLLIWLH